MSLRVNLFAPQTTLESAQHGEPSRPIVQQSAAHDLEH